MALRSELRKSLDTAAVRADRARLAGARLHEGPVLAYPGIRERLQE